MKTLRPTEVVTCCVCGEDVIKEKAESIFTGRRKYMCPGCYAAASRQCDGRLYAVRAPKSRRIKEEPKVNH